MKIRVLHVLNGLGHGGAEAFVMNMYRNMDREKVQFDFLVRSEDNSNYEEEVKRLGGKIYITASFPKNIIKNWMETVSFFRTHQEYDVVHVHANSLLYLLPLKLAKRYGVKCRIMHSHSTRSEKKFYSFIHNFNKKRVKRYVTDCFACSKKAGKWMFDCQFEVVKNAIDTKKYIFNEDMRNKIRNELAISNKYVIGHVGRFTYPKNHRFILEIFEKILKYRNDVILVLVGDGELKEEIEEKAKAKGIFNEIIFTGNKENVCDYLNAFDVFLFPSNFEGLGIVVIEAQASGLPCLVSDVIPEEAIITENVTKKSLNDSSEEWGKVITQQVIRERPNMYQEIKNAGFDMEDSVKDMEEFYLKNAYNRRKEIKE